MFLTGLAVLAWPLIALAEQADMTRKAPILLEGIKAEKEGKKKGWESFSREVDLPTPGVWYIWLKATNQGSIPAVLTYDLDGKQPLKSARAQIMIHPHMKSQWISYTRYAAYPGFRAQVHVEKAGKHTLSFRHLLGSRQRSGKVTIEKIALTLYFSARPDGDTLNHDRDPGGGRLEFPVSPKKVDGFREDWKSPAIEAAGRTYYVDSKDGDNRNSGRSPKKAWKTLAMVNGRRFKPGDAILLKRGGRWDEGLAPRGNGTARRWITIGAYGKGSRPYVNGANRPGVNLEDQSYWVIQDLQVTSDPEYGWQGGGIVVSASVGKPQPRGIKIYNCVAFDTGGSGITVGNRHGSEANGYDGVIIENCLTFANGGSGIEVNGSDQNGCRNSVIRYCTAYSNPGMAGIWIHSGQNGLIEHCVGYNNACINIWTWNSINVTIRHCEAYRGVPPRDAGGFDIDWGCEACTLEYCYSHHNEGVGILLMGNGTGKYRGFPLASRYNLCRYNVSEYDNPPLGLTETFDYGKVYNNVAVAPPYTSAALSVSGWPYNPWSKSTTGSWSGGWPAHTEFVNNILVAQGKAVPMWIDDYATRQHNVFDHNLFWRLDGKGPIIKWAGREHGKGFWLGTKEGQIPPDVYQDIEKFRKATGQETHGVHADPRLRDVANGGIGRLPLAAYRLLRDSPARLAGRPVKLSEEWLAARRKYLTDTGAEAYGIPMEPAPDNRDYWGGKLGSAWSVSIGAHEP